MVATGWCLKGCLATELFLLGLATLLKWARLGVRSFAFSLGMMISWQVLAWRHFPLLIGYWFWVGAGAIAPWLAASRLAGEKRRGVGPVIAEPTTLALLFVPIPNAVIAVALETWKSLLRGLFLNSIATNLATQEPAHT